MKLMTKALEKRFAEISLKPVDEDTIVIAKYYNPGGFGEWYAIYYDPERREFFGYVVIIEGRWHWFSLDELESFGRRFRFSIKRDLNWKEIRFSEIFGKKG